MRCFFLYFIMSICFVGGCSNNTKNFISFFDHFMIPGAFLKKMTSSEIVSKMKRISFSTI